MPDQISVSEFVAETHEDYKAPTASSFTTRTAQPEHRGGHRGGGERRPRARGGRGGSGRRALRPRRAPTQPALTGPAPASREKVSFLESGRGRAMPARNRSPLFQEKVAARLPWAFFKTRPRPLPSQTPRGPRPDGSHPASPPRAPPTLAVGESGQGRWSGEPPPWPSRRGHRLARGPPAPSPPPSPSPSAWGIARVPSLPGAALCARDPALPDSRACPGDPDCPGKVCAPLARRPAPSLSAPGEEWRGPGF